MKIVADSGKLGNESVIDVRLTGTPGQEVVHIGYRPAFWTDG